MQKWTTTAVIFTALAASSAQASVVGSLKDITGIPSAAIIAPSAGGSAVGVFGSFDLQINFVGGGFTAAMTQAFVDAGWIPSRSATVSSKPDLNVFSKLGKHGLDGCFEGEAFSRG